MVYETLMGSHGAGLNGIIIDELERPLTWVFFKVIVYLQVEYRKTAPLKDKVTILHKRKLYLTYGMVLCLVILTDYKMRRAGLSASAELLVLLVAGGLQSTHGFNFS